MDIGRQKNKDVADINAGDKSISRSHENDLISRRAAINKILGQPPEPHYPSWYAEQIKELPSAQLDTYWKEQCQSYEQTINKLRESLSTQPEIIRCKDCRYYNSEEKECLDLLGYGRRWEEDDFCSYAER